MYFFASLIPATVLVGVGYFILFSSTKAQGVVKAFGQILAVWVFVLAAVFPMAGGYATYADLSPVKQMMRSMHSGERSQPE
ncbi:MAG TPA: hypothetical protein VFR86_10520 [Burkholderiaceae bacterium]|nr:hypothetical protein [Burkholderiaceae bacterium]